MTQQQTSVVVYEFPLFQVIKMWEVPRGYTFYVDPAVGQPEPWPAENECRNVDVSYVAQGEWRVDTRLHPRGGFDVTAGEGLWPTRYTSRHRITATGEVNSWICITMLDRTAIWNRSLVKIHHGDAMTLETSDQDQYLFIVEGQITTNRVNNKNEMIKIPARSQPLLTATGETLMIRLWR